MKMSEHNVYVSVLLAYCCVMIAFTALTWSSPMLIKLSVLDENPLGRQISSIENSLLASLGTPGAAIGTIGFGTLSGKFGRKTLLIALGILLSIVHSTLAFSHNIHIYYVCRSLMGLACGGSLTMLPIYSAELANSNQRGISGVFFCMFMNLGMLIPYSIGPYLSFFWFHIVLVSISILYVVAFQIFGLESPYYLIRKNSTKAEIIASKLRSPNKVTEYLNEIKCVNRRKSGGFLLDIMKSRGVRRAFFMGTGSLVFIQLSGIAVIAAYNQRIFQLAGTEIKAEIFPIILGVVQLITGILVSTFVEKFCRKTLLYISTIGVGLSHFPVGLYFFLQSKGYDVSNISMLPIICLFFYQITTNLGISFIPISSLGEIFPPQVKGVAICFILLINSFCAFLLTFSFNFFVEILGIYYLFWIFSVSCLISILFTKLVIIETRGKTIQEIQDELNK